VKQFSLLVASPPGPLNAARARQIDLGRPFDLGQAAKE
jgi:hypothetical protein